MSNAATAGFRLLQIQRNQPAERVVLDRIQFRISGIDLGVLDGRLVVVAVGGEDSGEFEEVGFVGGFGVGLERQGKQE